LRNGDDVEGRKEVDGISLFMPEPSLQDRERLAYAGRFSYKFERSSNLLLRDLKIVKARLVENLLAMTTAKSVQFGDAETSLSRHDTVVVTSPFSYCTTALGQSSPITNVFSNRSRSTWSATSITYICHCKESCMTAHDVHRSM
jgi:phosphoserine phosphatase